MDVASSPDRLRSSGGEDLIYLAFTFWTVIGLCLDGWAHLNRPELESFLTPWHAVFYSGFALAAAWLATMTMRRRPTAPNLARAVPDGYLPAAVGLVVFAAGGVGDAIWHAVFGIEVGLDALLSPTHLLLLLGLLLGTSGPLRSAWRNPGVSVDPGSIRALLPALLSTAATTATVAFFFLYANGFNNWAMTRAFDGESGRGELEASHGVLATLATTVILLGPALVLLRRWRPPRGSITLVLGLVGVFLAGLDAFANWWQVIAPLAGGLVFDLIASPGRLRLEPRWTARVAGAASAFTLAAVAAPTIGLAWGLAWPPELWAGGVGMAALAGFGLAVLIHPPPTPAGAG